MSKVIIETTEATFSKDVLEPEAALVDFWAEWCGPCKAVAPIFEEVAKSYQGRLNFVKLDVDQSSDVSAKYGIRGIPTIILFKRGKVCAMKTGTFGRTELISFLEENL